MAIRQFKGIRQGLLGDCDFQLADLSDSDTIVWNATTQKWDSGPGGGGGVTDHGALTGLGDDDHTQYHTDARGDVRYYTQTAVDILLAGKADAGAEDTAVWGSVTGTLSDQTDLQAELDAKQAAGSYVDTAGDTMTGPLRIEGVFPNYIHEETDTSSYTATVLNNSIWAVNNTQSDGTFIATLLRAALGGAVTLFHDGSQAIVTTSYGAYTNGAHRVFNDPSTGNDLTRKSWVESRTWQANDIVGGVLDPERVCLAAGRINWSGTTATLQTGSHGIASVSSSATGVLTVTLSTSNANFATQRLVDITPTAGAIAMGGNPTTSTTISITSVNTITDAFQSNDLFILVYDT